MSDAWHGISFRCGGGDATIYVRVTWPKSTKHPKHVEGVIHTVRCALEDENYLVVDDPLDDDFGEEEAGGEVTDE